MNLLNLFINRYDDYAKMIKKNENEASYNREGKPITEELLQNHLEGKITIGTYQLDKERFVKWICWDFDGEIKEEGKKAVELFKKLRGEGKHPIIEFSGKKGWHVWLFIERIEGKYAYAYGNKLTEGIDCEVFPKQKELEEGKEFGNLVKVPLGVHKVTGKRSYFLNPDTLEPMKQEEALKLLDNWEVDTIPKIEMAEPVYAPTALGEIAKKPMPKETELLVKNGVGEGDRNASRFAVYNRLKYKGWSDDEILEVLLKFNNNCRPPEDESVIKRHWEQMVRDWKPQVIEKQETKTMPEIAHQFFEAKKDARGIITQFGKFIPKKLGDYILGLIPIKTLKDDDTMYRYNDGFYHNDAEPAIKSMCKEALGDEYSKERIAEVLSYIRSSTYIDRPDTTLPFVNFENGLLFPMTGEFISHTPDKFSIVRVPISYDPNAKCPLWEKEQNEHAERPEAVTVLQEWFGYQLMPKQKHEKALLVIGPPETMKSTTLFVLGKMVGDKNISAIPLQQLNDDQFAVAELYGKLANICADLDSYSLRNTMRFMTIAGGDPITAGKKYGQLVTWYPDTKLSFSANIVPGTTNKDLAFYRRWIILKYEKIHTTKDIEMKNKLVEELPGILNWALVGLKRLIENGKFSYWLSNEEVKDLYERSSDTITSFIFMRISTEDDESELTKREVRAAYEKYCEKNRLKKINPVAFGREFLAITGCGTCKKGRIPAYAGVGWKDEEPEVKQTNLTVIEFGG